MKRFILLTILVMGCLSLAAQGEFKVVGRGFLYDGSIPPTCHAATLAETRKGDIIAAFFGGTREGHPDSDIWTCRLNRKTNNWSVPAILADGIMTEYTRSAFDYEAVTHRIGQVGRSFQKTRVRHGVTHVSLALDGNKATITRIL